MSYDNTTIASAMRQIKNSELVLPAIQRDFVWSSERIYNFLDSLMRGYPIGMLLFWNTRQRIQYREFIKDKTDGFTALNSQCDQPQSGLFGVGKIRFPINGLPNAVRFFPDRCLIPSEAFRLFVKDLGQGKLFHG